MCVCVCVLLWEMAWEGMVYDSGCMCIWTRIGVITEGAWEKKGEGGRKKVMFLIFVSASLL